MSSLTRGLGRFTTMGMTMSTFAKTAGALPRAAVRSMCSTKHSTSGDGEEKGFNPETPQQRMVWLLSLGGVGAATVYFLYRVWRDYYTDEGQAASAEGVLSTPLFEGNPVVFLDVAADGEQLGRMVFQLRKDLGMAFRGRVPPPLPPHCRAAPTRLSSKHGRELQAAVHGGMWQVIQRQRLPLHPAGELRRGWQRPRPCW